MHDRKRLASAIAGTLAALALTACAAKSAPYVGSWRLESANVGGQQVDGETIGEASDDSPSCLVVSEDGSIDYSLLGALTSGRWEKGSDDNHATVHVDDGDSEISVDGDTLTLTRGSDENAQQLTFRRSSEDLGGTIGALRDAGGSQAIDEGAPETVALDAPVTVADDDTCLIQVTDRLSYADGHAGLRLAVTNRTDGALLVGCHDSKASVAGTETSATGGGSVGAGATVTMDLALDAGATGDPVDLELDVSDYGTYEVVATYWTSA